jgi:hypothetical protein
MCKRMGEGMPHATVDHISMRHPSPCLSEAEYRWNHREEDLFALVVIRLLIAATMQYKTLVNPAPEQTDNGPEVTLDGEPF